MYIILKLSSRPDGTKVVRVKHKLMEIAREAYEGMSLPLNDQTWLDCNNLKERDLVGASVLEAMTCLRCDLRNYFFFQLSGLCIAGINQNYEGSAEYAQVYDVLVKLSKKRSLELTDISDMLKIIRPMVALAGKYELLYEHVSHMRVNLEWLQSEFSKELHHQFDIRKIKPKNAA